MVPLPLACVGHGGGMGTAQLDWFKAATDIDEDRNRPWSIPESLTKFGANVGYWPIGPWSARSSCVTRPFSYGIPSLPSAIGPNRDNVPSGVVSVHADDKCPLLLPDCQKIKELCFNLKSTYHAFGFWGGIVTRFYHALYLPTPVFVFVFQGNVQKMQQYRQVTCPSATQQIHRLRASTQELLHHLALRPV